MDLLYRLALTIRMLLRTDWDCPIVVDGEEGSGKSMLALKLAMMIDHQFKIDKDHIVFRFGNLLDSIYNLKPLTAICHDEFGLSAFNRQAMTKRNIELVKAVMVCRDQNKALVLCVPSIWTLDNYIKFHRAKYWLHVYASPPAWNHPRQRGFVEIRSVVPRLWYEMPWYPLIGRYHFEPLAPEVYQDYRVLKKNDLTEQREGTETTSPKDERALQILLKVLQKEKDGGATMMQLERKYHIPHSTLNRWLSSVRPSPNNIDISGTETSIILDSDQEVMNDAEK
jgi:ABC-type dipeptide/oligopeptide/nickel transport system ATPase component